MSIPELKTAAQLAHEVAPKAEAPLIPDPRDSIEYTFDFSFTDVRGRTWAGKFTNRILNRGQCRSRDLLKIRLANQVPIESQNVDLWEGNHRLAHLTYSLNREAKDFPEWAIDLEKLYDEAIIEALWSEVAAHEARFRRLPSPTSGE